MDQSDRREYIGYVEFYQFGSAVVFRFEQSREHPQAGRTQAYPFLIGNEVRF
jgi:hypothetical protein